IRNCHLHSFPTRRSSDLFPAFFYSLWTELVFNGQTLGKILFKIRVVKLDGYRAGFTEYFTRWAFRIVDFWTGLFFLLFFIPIFRSEEHTSELQSREKIVS